jgi:hypothetical protein
MRFLTMFSPAGLEQHVKAIATRTAAGVTVPGADASTGDFEFVPSGET